MGKCESLANDFAKRNDGKIVGSILGKRKNTKGKFLPVGFKVEVEDFMFHIYYSREWYYKYDGITVADYQMQEAIDDNAVIVAFVGASEYWRHSTMWLEWAEQDKSIYHNQLYNHTEIFIKRRALLLPIQRTGFKLQQYFPEN